MISTRTRPRLARVLYGVVFALGGWLGCAAALAQTQPSTPAGAGSPAAQVDCSALADTRNSPITLDNCKQMMSGAQQAEAATKDPRGLRPGDDAMSCADIEKEMSTMRGIGPSEATRAEAGAAAAEYGAKVESKLAQLHAEGVAATAAINAAAAADLATQLATGGLVNPHSAQAMQQAALAQGVVQGDRMAKEMQPSGQRMFKAAGGGTQEMAQQMQSNPRFARLISLAMAKDCKGPDEVMTTSPIKVTPANSPIGR
jgi:hypothetical protein